jgi:UDP-2,3-diacylglucosamine pyrophosphatase LpxH
MKEENRMERDIFVVSDLHLGDGGPRDNFGYEGSPRPELLNRFLDFVQAENGELIVVGDLFEFWQAPLAAVVMHNLPLLERLDELGATLILGNHDSDLAAFAGTGQLSHPFFTKMQAVSKQEPFERTINGRRFALLHGHEVDEFNSNPAPSWGRMLTIFAGIFEERNGSPLLADGESIETVLEGWGEKLLSLWNWLTSCFSKAGKSSAKPKDELTPAQNPDRAKQMLDAYAEYRQEQEIDVLICGHTHQPGRIGDWYYNSGGWATTNNNFLRIAPDGMVSVFDWTEDGPVRNDTVLREED